MIRLIKQHRPVRPARSGLLRDLAMLGFIGATFSACGADGSQPPKEAPVIIVPRPPSPPPPPTGPALTIGAQIGPGEAAQHCERLDGDNNEATSLWVKWGEVPQTGGRYDWTALDRQIDGFRSCGLDVALHVQSRLDSGSRQPPDLALYVPFLAEMASRYRDRVSRYSIENEAASESQWPAEPESYFALLVAAYSAIKTADPAAIVQDSGLSAGTLGFLRVDELYRAGQVDAALALLDRVRAGLAGNADDPPPPATREGLAELSVSPSMARKRRWIELLREHRGSLDALQIHFYGDWDLLPETMRWIQAQGIARPIEVWELSERRARDFVNDSEVAEDMVKLITIAAGEGSTFTLFYNYVDWFAPAGYFPGLVDGGGQSRLAIRTAFQLLTEQITDAVSAAPVDLGTGVWAYRFAIGGSGRVVHVLWSAAPRTVALPSLGDGQVRVTAIDGRESVVSARAIPVSTTPVIVSVTAT